MSPETLLEQLDRQIILATQSGLPLVPQPYRMVAEQVGCTPEMVMQRMRQMLESGVIRRIAAVPNHYALGYSANGMTVWDVDDGKIDELGERIGQLESVSHCYQRPRYLPDWPYNLFAMVHGHDRAEVELKARQIEEILGNSCRRHEILYSTKILKKTGLRIV